MKKLAITVCVLSALALSWPAQSGCLRGGEGATACSSSIKIGGLGIGGSVSCGEGYYACCGLIKAKCIKQ